MSAQFVSVPNGASNSMKLIRFFRIVGVLGGMLIFARAWIVVAAIGAILYILP